MKTQTFENAFVWRGLKNFSSLKREVVRERRPEVDRLLATYAETSQETKRETQNKTAQEHKFYPNFLSPPPAHTTTNVLVNLLIM